MTEPFVYLGITLLIPGAVLAFLYNRRRNRYYRQFVAGRNLGVVLTVEDTATPSMKAVAERFESISRPVIRA